LSLKPGARVRVTNREYDETMTLSLAGAPGKKMHIGKPATERIWVRRVSAA
jgi:hypothetical protein